MFFYRLARTLVLRLRLRALWLQFGPPTLQRLPSCNQRDGGCEYVLLQSGSRSFPLSFQPSMILVSVYALLPPLYCCPPFPTLSFKGPLSLKLIKNEEWCADEKGMSPTESKNDDEDKFYWRTTILTRLNGI